MKIGFLHALSVMGLGFVGCTTGSDDTDKDLELVEQAFETGEKENQDFLHEDAVAATTLFIKSSANKRGYFRFKDPLSKKPLSLKLVKVVSTVKHISSGGYRSYADFRTLRGPKKKVYGIEFRLEPKNGQLVVRDAKIFSRPKYVKGRWKRVSLHHLPERINEDGEPLYDNEPDVSSFPTVQ